ncbi:hypothetical protein IF188_08265 [Microbacterium sp. NEAU-LLC]|uniref:Uncharacterized protein n=1 Tax=Microbacterium helvum TaxID=2773713 RepID=A0ABR8NLZ2_9MICO|nr:hypothetical protein [Microbacterium helvum]MBD3941686.1 hypothetical protein [Microbacterium helvum]
MTGPAVVLSAWTAAALAVSAGMTEDEVVESCEFMVAAGDLTRIECGGMVAYAPATELQVTT